MADLFVISELRDYLVSSGACQAPDQPVSMVLPSVWEDPRDGAPEPRPGEDVTITLRDTMLAPAASLEAWIEETFVDVIVRSRKPAQGKLVQRAIRDLIHPITAHGGKKQWTMGALVVEYSTIWRSDQKLPPPPGVTNPVSYDRVQSFRFGCRRKALAGQPTVP